MVAMNMETPTETLKVKLIKYAISKNSKKAYFTFAFADTGAAGKGLNDDSKQSLMEAVACKRDCMILADLASMELNLPKLEWISGFDYQLVMLPLVKSFIRKNLEDLTLFEEFDTDNKEGKKAKHKKKQKKQSKANDFKASGDSAEQQAPRQEIAEQVCSPHPFGRDFMGATELKGLQEEELKVKLQLQMYQQIFQQVRDQQGQIEGRGKREQPAALNVKTGGILAENGADCVSVSHSKPGGDEDEDPLIGKIGNSEGPLSVSANSEEGTPGLSSLPTPEDGDLASDIRRGGKQHTYQAQKVFALKVKQKMPQKLILEEKESRPLPADVEADNMSGSEVFGTGLKNDIGEQNCFLNVVIQSLWHLRRFRQEFMHRSAAAHVHARDTCVVCGLYDIFSALIVASRNTHGEAVAATSLRIALSNLYRGKNLFKEGQMNDASEVLTAILERLHYSFTPTRRVPDNESEEIICCANKACLAHTLFGMDIFERMKCDNCGFESRHLKYTSLFHHINASELRAMKISSENSSFDELLKLVQMNYQLACDIEAGGCGKWNRVQYILSTSPHFFTVVLGWQSNCESADNILATLTALTTEIDIGVLYQGSEGGKKYYLVSMICYYRHHYQCYAYSHKHDRWILYDDTIVKVIGNWNDVLAKLQEGKLQPQVLFFEAE